MTIQNWLSDMFDSVLAPTCVNDSCSSGFIAGLGEGGMSGTSQDMSTSTFGTYPSDDDWTSAWGTQASFQPAAECGSIASGSTFDAYSSFDSGPGSTFGSDW